MLSRFPELLGVSLEDIFDNREFAALYFTLLVTYVRTVEVESLQGCESGKEIFLLFSALSKPISSACDVGMTHSRGTQ